MFKLFPTIREYGVPEYYPEAHVRYPIGLETGQISEEDWKRYFGADRKSPFKEQAIEQLTKEPAVATKPTATEIHDYDYSSLDYKATSVLTPTTLAAIARIESGNNPRAVTGSYKGLFQLSEAEFQKRMPGGDIFNPEQNTKVATELLQEKEKALTKMLGRQPTVAEVYLAHQQGLGGAKAHLTAPDTPAWQNMLNTAEGQRKGEAWAKQAIWGNIPDQAKAKFGSVENVTSRDFVELWTARVNRELARTQPAPQPARQPAISARQPPQSTFVAKGLLSILKTMRGAARQPFMQ